ncbi:zinc-binding protein A33-like [Mugil cephalus]|uniref:zinc-binding protein A33-like n=1 Tax=Mugil cephalus TaxID=48193 RepID=UPI001FB7867A|nr:zinc-binding protein A33-like [Mugil cephalus]
MATELDKDLFCTLCENIFKDPVTLSCSHSFCNECLKKHWTEKETHECPLCKRRSSKERLPPTFELKSQNEVFFKEGSSESDPVCSVHSEKLNFFCLDDQQLVCSVCKDSETHSNHRFKATEEADEERKKQLEDSLKLLKTKRRLIHQVKGDCDQTAEHIKVQAESTVWKIREEFRKLHQFLDEEEEARMAALKEEEEQKSLMMKEKIKSLSKEVEALSITIKATEKELRAGDVSFLQNFKAAEERVQHQPLPEDPELPSGSLIDVAKHLGNLSFNIWTKMKEMVSYSPVILDPNSAHPQVVLSDDLTSLRKVEMKQDLPDNPERIDLFFSAVGSEGFDSGCHSWEVEVGDNQAYVLGVLPEKHPRKGTLRSGLWRLMFCSGEYKTLSPLGPESDVTVATNPKKIRVKLDQDGGRLTFSDSDTDEHIHTFTHTFTDKLFPYISTWSDVPIKIVPLQVSVTVEPHD